jgi:hypothetical protein
MSFGMPVRAYSVARIRAVLAAIWGPATRVSEQRAPSGAGGLGHQGLRRAGAADLVTSRQARVR